MPARRELIQKEFGLYLLLASLGMFFLGAMWAFILMRKGVPVTPGRFPPVLWASTAVLLVGGISLQQSLREVRRERQLEFRRWLLTAFGCGCLFCILQTIGLTDLLLGHFVNLRSASLEPPISRFESLRAVRFWGFLFVLVLLHVLHFIGGLVVLFRVVLEALRGRFDHEFYPGVKLCAVYWRFLDVVWLMMLAAFTLTL
ncbi:cytochrome c oxidase subunit 3 [Planctellipticum variicoloris]|uniref:cytochrome c oxidase subunit 3 n=1 Tax=Planctellipticum variicoloris TaxID=3064265 RepID=UPI003013F211|nr:hypothetical protein SH412_005151 [Planctomycetaceae bacterium SH412]